LDFICIDSSKMVNNNEGNREFDISTALLQN